MIRISAAFVLGIYLGAGLFSGLLLQRAIPALNPIGITYVATTWPRVIICARVSAGCEQVGPEWLKPWLFTFSAQGQ